MPYRLCLCDLDNTLFDFSTCERAALAATLSSFELPVSDAVIAHYSAVNDRHWKALERGETTQQRLRVERFRDFLLESGYAHVDPEAMSRLFVGFLSQQHAPMRGAEDFCRRVSAKMPLYAVTNGIAQVQHQRMFLSELKPYFRGIVISEEIGAAKPDPKMLYEAMRLAGETDKSAAVLVGDSLTSDIAAARAAGIDSVLFTRHRPAPTPCPATYAASTLAQAADIVLREGAR